MRIADKMGYDQVTSNLSKNRTDMADLQNQAATQKRVTKPSDDPLAAARVLATRTEVQGGQQFMKSVNTAKTFLEYSEQSLVELTELLNRAKELAISQSSDASGNTSTRQVTASEIDQLFNQAVQVGNRKLGDRFLFGGFKTTRPPFTPEGVYKGDNGEINISVQKAGTVAINLPGSRIFLGQGLKGRTTESDASGERSGAGQARVNSRGPASVQSSLNSKNQPDFAEGIQDADAKTDSEIPNNMEQTWASSGVDIFKVLRDLSTGLRADDKESIHESLDLLDGAMSQVVMSRAQLGSRVSTLNGALESHQKTQVDAKGLISTLEDVDTFELVSEINKTETTLKAALTTSGKLIQPSLLDFLR